MLLTCTPWKYQKTFRLYNIPRTKFEFGGAHRLCTPESLVKFFEYFVVIVLLFFLAKEEYKVRYDEKEREAKDLNEKVTVIFFVIVRKLRYE